ncbi:hypothetical protein [Aureimonas sp. N4]|nr:hypothetical protein [Aureimonas sp. N4]
MSNVDPLIWISLFGLAVGIAGLVGVEISSRRFDRAYGRRKS